MRFVHCDLAAELPDEWCDCSSILMIRPGEQADVGAPAFTASFVETEESAQRITTEHVARLKGLCVGMRILRSGPFQTRLGAGWHFLLLLPAGEGAACQLIVGVNRPKQVVLATAAAPEASFARWESELTAILASLAPGSAPP